MNFPFFRHISTWLLLFFLSNLVSRTPLRANGDIFPATAAAQDKINWKDGYFYINGQPTFLTSGEMHYARIPRELWRDRIWRAKQMGFNCIQMYVFWNATEGREGQWDFTDNLDLDAWLSLIQEMGMYAIVRVGPYSCAEWEHGGFPAWLTIKPDMTLRDTGEQYLHYVDQHLAKIYQIVARHQIHQGGNVLMVQLENEYPKGWGTSTDPYLSHLYDQARAAGLEIPLFYSGLHHGGDPSGEVPFDSGESPWYSTEFWTGWIGKYGEMEPAMLDQKIRGTWKIIAFGGAGYDYYVVHGGTNFGYSGDSFEASYDYSAPIGEAGQLRNFYYAARRAAYFAQSFSSLLTSSKDDPSFATSSDPRLRVTTRTSPGGSMVMIDHFDRKNKAKAEKEIPPEANAYQIDAASPVVGGFPTQITLRGEQAPVAEKLMVQSEEPRTLLCNVPWTANATFKSIVTNIFLRHKIGETEYWVCYGPGQDTGEVTIQRKIGNGLPDKVDFIYPTDTSVKEIPIDSGDHHQILLLVMKTETTNRTWLVKDQLSIGPDFVREDGTPEFSELGGKAIVYQATGKSTLSCPPLALGELPKLANWAWRSAANEGEANYPDKDWLSSQGPLAMEAYGGYQNRYGWYRTVLPSETETKVSLRFSGESGKFLFFVNGKLADPKELPLQKGDNQLAIFAKIGPRPKLYVFTGAIGFEGAKGLWGPLSIAAHPDPCSIDWKKTTKLDSAAGEGMMLPSFDDAKWDPIDLAKDHGSPKLEKGTTWFRGTFTGTDELKSCFLKMPVLGSASTIYYLNGKALNSAPASQWLLSDLTGLLGPGRNVLAFSVTSNRPETTVRLPLEFWPKMPTLPWHFREGLENLTETQVIGRVTNWPEFLAKPWTVQGAPEAGLPVFWKSTFLYHATGWETIGLNTAGLQAGHIWLNGHNLGESPQKVPMYLPECWLKEGANDLVIFDMYGAKPDMVTFNRFETHQTMPDQGGKLGLVIK